MVCMRVGVQAVGLLLCCVVAWGGCKPTLPPAIDHTQDRQKELRDLGLDPKATAPFWSSDPVLEGILPVMENRAAAPVMRLTYQILRKHCAKGKVPLGPQESVALPRTVLEAGRDVALGAAGRRGPMPSMTDFELAALTAALWRRQGFEASLMWRPRNSPGAKGDQEPLKMQVGVTLPGAGVMDTTLTSFGAAMSPREQGWRPLGDVEAMGVHQSRLAGGGVDGRRAFEGASLERAGRDDGAGDPAGGLYPRPGA